MTSPYRDLDLLSGSQNLSQSLSRSHSRTSTPSASVRPRHRRHFSGSTELTTASDLGLSLGLESAAGRDASPIPPKHPSRIASGSAKSGNGRPVGGLVLLGNEGKGNTTGSPTMGFGRGLWGGVWTGSWSAVQGLASSYLGVEVGDDSAGEDNSPVKKGKTMGTTGRKGTAATWGPSGLRQRVESNGAGSVANLSAALTAKKTASVLESHDGVNGGLDVNGNYKRRTSLEAPLSPGKEEEALCYVHVVLPTDTQTGVVLRYQCRDTAAFRKANRLYPNDPIQLRKTVLLLVDTCTIKGRPCEGPSEAHGIDLLAPTPRYEDAPNSSSYTNGGSWSSSSKEQDNPFAASAPPPKETGDEPWTHVRWVLLFSSPSSNPTEIVRLSRRTLGFFPPRRRKSQTHLSSTLSSPRSSVDLVPHDSSFGTSSRIPSNLIPQQNISSYFPPTSSTLRSSSLTRSRADSTSSIISTTSNTPPRIPNFMRRPGGVGTMARNVRAPGPAQDGFNAWATRQFPALTIDHLPSTSGSTTAGVENLGFGFSDELASIDEIPFQPRAAAAAVEVAGAGGSFGMGIGGLESWVRKTIARAPGTPISKPVTGRGVGHLDGDLIELLDGTGSDDGRGFEPAVNSFGGVVAGGGREEVGRESSMGTGVGTGIGGVRGRSGKGKSE